MDLKRRLFEDYGANVTSFVNKYKSSKKYNTEFYKQIDVILEREYSKFGPANFSEIFYNIKYLNITNICKICDSKTKFKNYKSGYKQYCSLKCSRSDGSKTSAENKFQGSIKRSLKMKKLLTDPVLGKEYREKIGKKTKERMNIPEIKKARSIWLKQKILSGEFTPNITNTWTHWNIKLNNKCFRSSFEAIFYLYQTKHLNNNVLYEKLRLPYYYNNKNKIYIVDFIDYENKKVYEIKPKSLSENDNNIEKRKCLLQWCNDNNFEYYEINETQIKQFAIKISDILTQYPVLQNFYEKYKWN